MTTFELADGIKNIFPNYCIIYNYYFCWNNKVILIT